MLYRKVGAVEEQASKAASAASVSVSLQQQLSTDKLSPQSKTKQKGSVDKITPGHFEAEQHFYPRVLNANIHPLVASFFSLGNDRIMARYSHLNPSMDVQTLKNLLSYEPQYFRWAGIP